MNRSEFEKFISNTYGAVAEHPWFRYPSYAVYRHKSNNKWFAVVMDIPKAKLGIDSEGEISIVNLKCDPILIDTLVEEDGFFPAYHMNKVNWISVALDGGVEKEALIKLLGMSYNTTEKTKTNKNVSSSQ